MKAIRQAHGSENSRGWQRLVQSRMFPCLIWGLQISCRSISCDKLCLRSFPTNTRPARPGSIDWPGHRGCHPLSSRVPGMVENFHSLVVWSYGAQAERKRSKPALELTMTSAGWSCSRRKQCSSAVLECGVAWCDLEMSTVRIFKTLLFPRIAHNEALKLPQALETLFVSGGCSVGS